MERNLFLGCVLNSSVRLEIGSGRSGNGLRCLEPGQKFRIFNSDHFTFLKNLNPTSGSRFSLPAQKHDIACVILLFVEFKLCRLCPLIVLTLSFSCVSFDFLLCEIQIVLTLAFCCVHFDFFNFCRLCPSIVLTLAFYCVDFK